MGRRRRRYLAWGKHGRAAGQRRVCRRSGGARRRRDGAGRWERRSDGPGARCHGTGRDRANGDRSRVAAAEHRFAGAGPERSGGAGSVRAVVDHADGPCRTPVQPTAAPTPAPSGGSSAGTAVEETGSASSAAERAAPTVAAAPRGGGTTRERSRGTRSKAMVEQTVAELQPCLDRLGARERQVLSLRAGLGPRAPLSRPQVARRLDLGVAQTGRIERRGLRRLDRLAGAGACGGGAADAASLPTANSAAAGQAGGSSAGLAPRFGVGGVTAHGGDESGEGSGGRSGLGLPPPIGSGGEATLLVVLGLLVVLALLVRRELQRR